MATPSAPAAAGAGATVPDFCKMMFEWVKQQGEAMKNLPVGPENAAAMIKAYEAMFKTTHSLVERMAMPEAAPAPFVVPAAYAATPTQTDTTMRTIVSPREQIAAQVARATGEGAPRAAPVAVTREQIAAQVARAIGGGAPARGAAKNGSLRAANRGVQKTAAAKKGALSLREYGYAMKSADRTGALRAAIQKKGADAVSERLDFLNEVWGDNRNPAFLENIREDIAYVRRFSDETEATS
jgi:hypothetical protein